MRLFLSVALVIAASAASVPAMADTEVDDWVEKVTAQCTANFDNTGARLPSGMTAYSACSCVVHRIADGHDRSWIENQPLTDPAYMRAKFASCGVAS